MNLLFFFYSVSNDNACVTTDPHEERSFETSVIGLFLMNDLDYETFHWKSSSSQFFLTQQISLWQ